MKAFMWMLGLSDKVSWVPACHVVQIELRTVGVHHNKFGMRFLHWRENISVN